MGGGAPVERGKAPWNWINQLVSMHDLYNNLRSAFGWTDREGNDADEEDDDDRKKT